ncbi:MAG: polysaccharide biosynthesis protein, partial [Eubacteriales bacterium]
KKQIAAGGPLTVTDPRMTRYFMTIPEASQLVIQAGAMASGGEIFILDMGTPVKIIDLAKDLIRLSGLQLDKDIKIKVSGIRPGEKLYEELLTDEEGTTATKHRRIFVARPNDISSEAIENLLKVIREQGSYLSRQEVEEQIRLFIPDFRQEACLASAK